MLHFFFSSLLWHHFYLICYLDVLSENFQRSGPFFLMLTQSRAYNIQNSWHFYRVDMTLKSIFEFGCLAYCLFSHCIALLLSNVAQSQKAPFLPCNLFLDAEEICKMHLEILIIFDMFSLWPIWVVFWCVFLFQDTEY